MPLGETVQLAFSFMNLNYGAEGIWIQAQTGSLGLEVVFGLVVSDVIFHAES